MCISMSKCHYGIVSDRVQEKRYLTNKQQICQQSEIYKQGNRRYHRLLTRELGSIPEMPRHTTQTMEKIIHYTVAECRKSLCIPHQISQPCKIQLVPRLASLTYALEAHARPDRQTISCSGSRQTQSRYATAPNFPASPPIALAEPRSCGTRTLRRHSDSSRKCFAGRGKDPCLGMRRVG